MVLINARSGRRQLIWSELDSNATSPASTALLIHPAKNLREGERYIVALRRLRGADGALLEPSPAFRRYRDRIGTDSVAFERRRPHMERIFRSLRRAGIARRGLYRAWDFTVASAHGLSGRMRHIRDDAFGGLGDRRLGDLRVDGASPPFSVERVTEFAACGTDGCQAGEDAGHKAPRGGHGGGALLPRPAGLSGRLALLARPGRPASAAAGQRPPGRLHLQHPALGQLGQSGAGVALRPRPVRKRAARSTASPAGRSPPSTG